MKFAFITPRYGGDIASGPEHACRLLAEQVGQRHDVEVLTTCARGARSSKNDFAEGVDRIRGALVRRFAVSPASPGPSSSGLIDHLKRQHRAYDALLFFSVTSPLTIQGVPVAPERSILFPHLQLQPELRLDEVGETLASAGAIGYVSTAERKLLRAYFRVTPQHEEMVGIGIDPPHEQSYPRHQQDPADVVAPEEDEGADEAPEPDEGAAYLSGRGVPFRRRHRLYGSFVLYAGRVEPDNGSEELLEYFDTFASAVDEIPLVLMGVKMMKVPDERYVRMAGVLPERERMIAYEAAAVTIAPLSNDLLAQPVLESFAVGTPVLASSRNEAAVEHCRRSNAGLYYAHREEFVEALRILTTDARLRDRLAANGRSYIKQHYRWDAVLGRFDRLVSRVRQRA